MAEIDPGMNIGPIHPQKEPLGIPAEPAFNVGPLGPIQSVPDDIGVAQGTPAVDFKDILQKSINQIGELNEKADQALSNLSTGELQDVHQVMIALEKADLTFRAMMQIRTKLVDAYQEIMRMRF
jgi:flagellar hook-basal body complex protein FliE